MLTRRDMLAASAAFIAAGAGGARADAIDRPVKMIIGFPAGGGTDVIGRVLAQKLDGAYAKTVVVENRPGAAARVSVEAVKSAEPDGTTMLFTPDFPLTVYPYSFKSLSYDPLKDLTPVAPASSSMLTFNVGPAVPASVKTVKDFLAWAKANPGKASYATTSAGSTPHFVGVMLSSASGVALQPIHYRGGAPALQDLVGGHIPASINPISEAMPLAAQGAIRILAVTGPRRSRFLPDIPTLRESGYDVGIESWLGVFLPAGAPPAVVEALNGAIQAAVREPDYADSIAKFGGEPMLMSAADFAARLKADVAKWGPIVKASGFVATD